MFGEECELNVLEGVDDYVYMLLVRVICWRRIEVVNKGCYVFVVCLNLSKY